MARLLLAEFADPDALSAAIRALRAQGFRELDAHTPYSTESVQDALALPESRVGTRVFVGGLAGAVTAYALQWYLVAYSYPLNVGGRPPHLPLAFVPISFEMGVLFAAFTGFLSVFQLGKLGRLYDPLFEIDGFESASRDGFWLSVRGHDPRFDERELARRLEAFGPLRQVVLAEEK